MRSERPDGQPARRSERGAIPVRLVLGLLVLALGGVALANNLGWVEGEEILPIFLPAAFVAIGLAIVAQPAGRGPSRWWGLVWIAGGAWIYAHRAGWIEIEFWDVVFPAVLLLLGGSLVWGVVSRGRAGSRSGTAADPGARPTSIAVMAGNDVRSVSEAFRGADLVAFMGAVVLDLRQAKLEGGAATIDVFTMWGGIEIRVPKEWVVVSSVIPFMGAYEDKTEPSSGPHTGRLTVRGAVVMGGIEVKS